VRKPLLYLLLALLAGASIVWVLQFGSGYILISAADTTIEMSAWTGLIIYLVASALLVWLLLTWRWIVGAGGFRLWWSNRRNTRKINQTAEGLLLFASDNWQDATKVLLQSAERSAMPVINLLFAARAAADDEQFERAQQILQRLKTAHPQSGFIADRALAELCLLQERPAEALQILNPIHAKNPRDKAVLRLLADAFYLAEDWVALQKLLRDLKHYHAVGERDLASLEQDVYCNLLDQFAAEVKAGPAGIGELENIWHLIPKKLRRDPEIIASYAAALGRAQLPDRQQALLIKTLNKQWHPQLLAQFAELDSPIPERQLAAAEKWLAAHREDADLLLALGQICQRMQFWGKAKDYLTVAIKLRPTAQGYAALAAVLDKIGDNRGSGEAYRQGLLTALAQQNEQA